MRQAGHRNRGSRSRHQLHLDARPPVRDPGKAAERAPENKGEEHGPERAPADADELHACVGRDADLVAGLGDLRGRLLANDGGNGGGHSKDNGGEEVEDGIADDGLLVARVALVAAAPGPDEAEEDGDEVEQDAESGQGGTEDEEDKERKERRVEVLDGLFDGVGEWDLVGVEVERPDRDLVVQNLGEVEADCSQGVSIAAQSY